VVRDDEQNSALVARKFEAGKVARINLLTCLALFSRSHAPRQSPLLLFARV
jgi:hypothetical protein